MLKVTYYVGTRERERERVDRTIKNQLIAITKSNKLIKKNKQKNIAKQSYQPSSKAMDKATWFLILLL